MEGVSQKEQLGRLMSLSCLKYPEISIKVAAKSWFLGVWVLLSDSSQMSIVCNFITH